MTYQANDCVLLEAGFEFNPSDEGSFLAQIGPCVAEDNNANFVNSEGAAGQGFVQTSDDDYLYDDNGNMIQDPNKQLNIEYNYLNLPYRISSYDGSKVIRIDYDATGKKIRKAVLNSDNNTGYTQSYLDGIEYRNINPEAIYLPEGRLFNTGSTWRYEFDLKDHLGNTRVSFTDKNGDGIIQFDDNNDLINEILSEQQFYPFGLSCRGPWYTSPSPTKYQFGDKEFNDDFGLDWSDYGFRWYDATIARWNSVDPLADQMPAWSPYNYAFNNPLRFVDPDGRAPEDWIKINDQYQYDAEVKNQDQATEKYGDGAKYVGETHRYTAFNGGTVQLHDNGTWNYLGAPFNPPTPSPGAVNELFSGNYVQVGVSDALAANGADKISKYVKGRGYSGPNSNIYGNALSDGQVKSLRFRTPVGTVKGQNLLRLSNIFNYIGNGAAAFGYLSIANSAIQGGVSPQRALVDVGVVTYGWKGGVKGASFGFGYGILGPLTTSTETYQNWKQNTWLPFRNKIFTY